MSDAKIRRITKLMNELNADGDVKNSGLESAYTSNAYAASTFTSNTYVSDVFVSNNFFQNSSTYRTGEVIEDYYIMPDGSQITTIGGTANTEAVTSSQSFNNTQTKITGSELTGYVVPSGAKYVQYSFEVTSYKRNSGYNIAINSHVYLYYKINGGSYNQVQYHPELVEMDTSSNNPATYRFTFEVGAASANVQLGQMTETTPKLDFKIEMRGRQASQGANLHTTHGTEPWGTAPTPGSFSPPFVGIKATAG